MLAHIVGGGPVWPLWITGTVLFGGGVAATAASGRLRRACLAASGTLGNWFDIWGIPLDATHVGPATGTVVAYLNGQVYSGDLRSIPLDAHSLVQLDVNGNVPPAPFTFPPGL